MCWIFSINAGGPFWKVDLYFPYSGPFACKLNDLYRKKYTKIVDIKPYFAPFESFPR